VVCAFLTVVLRYSFSFMTANADQLTPYLLFPMSYVYMVIPFTVGFMVLFLALDTVRLLGTMAGRGNGSSSAGR
jgi:TRAP-type C4-dicarboxylate transport system permease small subunit